jgi:hypothetical protein
MLSPEQLELLTAYVDGELSSQQRRVIRRLLLESKEARAMLRKLEEDARQVRQMPMLKIPVDLSTRVQMSIERQKVRPVATTHLPTPEQRISVWMGLAVAASVMLLVGATAFFLNSDDAIPQPGKSRAIVSNRNKPAPRDKEQDRITLLPKDNEKDTPPLVIPDFPEDTWDKDFPIVKPEGTNPPRDTTPRRKNETVLGSGDVESFDKFEFVIPKLPMQWRLHELYRAETSKQVRDELLTSKAFRIELLARDATRGFDHLRAALQAKKIQVVIDPAVQPRLKKPLWKTDYALFVENVIPDDLIDVLRATGVADRDAAEKKSTELRFDGPMVVKQLAGIDRRELHDLLGVDPIAIRPMRLENKGIDIRQPISDVTASQLAAALEGKGTPRPGTAPEVTAFVTMLGNSKSRSADLKRYLETRRPEHPGSLQVMLIVRHIGG